MIKSRKLAALAALFVVAAGAASADSLFYSTSSSVYLGSQTNLDVSLPNFSKSLGTLTSVSLLLQVYPQLGFLVQNPLGNSQQFSNAGGTFTADLTGPGGATTGGNVTALTSGTVGPFDFGFESAFSFDSFTLNVNPSIFSAFENPPSGSNGSYTVAIGTLNGSFPFIPNLFFFDIYGNASVDTAVSYTYTPAVTPEPAPFAALGLGAFGLVLRKRRK